MPPPQIKEESRVLGEAAKKPKKSAAKKNITAKTTEQDLLFDLMGDGSAPATDLSATLNGSQNNADLLADILGGSNSVSTSPVSPQSQQSNMASIMDLFGNSNPPPSAATQNNNSADLLSSMSSPPPQPSAAPPSYPCYSKNNLTVTLQLQRNSEGITLVMARFLNSSFSSGMTGVNLQAAVPKTQKLQLNAISSPDLEPGAEATQTMRIQGSKGVSPSKCTVSTLTNIRSRP